MQLFMYFYWDLDIEKKNILIKKTIISLTKFFKLIYIID